MLVMSALVFAGIYMVGDPVSMLASPEATEAQRAAIRNRNVLQLIDAGGNVYYLAKFAGILKLDVQDLGAQQTGMTKDAFKAKLLAYAKD